MTNSLLANASQKGFLPLLLLALCGCSSEGEEPPPSCGGKLVAVVTGGLSCIGNSGTSSPPPPSPPVTTPPPPTPPTRSVVMNSVDEYEPNSTFDNANPVSFPTGSAGGSIGIEIFGDVTEGEDTSDFFIFTPPKTDVYAIYLCGETCVDQPVTDEVYISIYDQTQTTIESTPIGVMAEQFIGVELAAGVAYYLEINGYNSGEGPWEYQLVVID